MLTGLVGTLPHDGCIDQRRWVLNSWGFRRSVHIGISPLHRSFDELGLGPGAVSVSGAVGDFGDADVAEWRDNAARTVSRGSRK